MRSRLLFLVFVLSGAAGLVFEVVLQRELSRVFGVSAFAAATVLAAYMVGLSLGAWASWSAPTSSQASAAASPSSPPASRVSASSSPALSPERRRSSTTSCSAVRFAGSSSAARGRSAVARAASRSSPSARAAASSSALAPAAPPAASA